MRILLFGPQGVGKGTQAALLSAHFSIPHISTGDLFRAHVAADSPLGREASAIMASGALVPDEVTQAMVSERLDGDDCRDGFILDGFPRNQRQAEWLTSTVLSSRPLHAVILLTAAYEVLMQRATQRGRTDDTPEIIERRLVLYHQQTEPLLTYYSALIHSVDGTGPVQSVLADILTELSTVDVSERPRADR